MSNLNPSDPTRNHPDKIASNNKVIVLSMKNMPSFKFDPSKNFLANNTTSADSAQVYSFKPQQLIQSSQSQISSAPQKLQVVQQAVPKIGPAATILIRAQSSSSKPQFTSLTNCPNVKIQEAPVKVQANVNKDVSSTIPTFRNKVTNEITMKTQSGHKLLLQPATIVKTQSVLTKPVQVPIGARRITIASAPVSASSPITIAPSKMPPLQKSIAYFPSKWTAGVQAPAKLVPIRPKVDPETVNLLSQQIIATHNAKVAEMGTNVRRSFVVIPAPVPALTLIRPKSPKIVIQENVLVQGVSASEDVDHKELELETSEVIEMTPEKQKRTSIEERLLEVKRIIEGDQDDIPAHLTVVQQQSEPASEPEEEMEIDDEPQDSSEASASQELPDSSSSMLLCDEKIENVSPEVSPNEGNKSKDVPATPMETDDDNKSSETNSVIQDVRKNLSRELSLECDKENVNIAIDDDSISDNSSMTESQRQLLQDYEEPLLKSEIPKSSSVDSKVSKVPTKQKRNRKPKNATIIASLGLPYKPSQPSSRKSKVEKKLEFELDFHDPLNKIQWDDGIGGLNNCNKLFGFDEFGLIEVLGTNDATAKLKQLDIKDSSNSQDNGASYKLRKISDPIDHFNCVVCSKLGTIRDFYSPECCSESCLAITKRKSGEFNPSAGKESSSESGVTTPIDERKLMFGGEMIPLQQLQQHLLEQQLPPSKRQRSKKRPGVFPQQESKFQWDTYLSSKSVPAPMSLFKNPYPRTANPFKVGMKLEAIDPENQKLFCVCTVEEKLGYRIKLHFDGYPTAYDIWVNADSNNIFPSGFCHSTNRELQTPPKWSNKKFDWSEYLDHTNSIGAQRAMFPRMNQSYDDNPFEVGMKLETMREGKLYAASVIDVLEDRVLISHDGHEELGCIWIDIRSPYLHPCNYHNTIADPECFIPPYRPFSWKEYLKSTASKEAPSEFLFFRTRSAYEFESGLKLEVVDRVNRQLIRPATVLCRTDYKIQVIYDGFDINFAFWLDDDSEDLHPINWCEKTQHPIEHPAGFNKADNGLCPTAGCRGIGNGAHADRYFHDNINECPYSAANWKKLLKQSLGSHVDSKNIAKRLPNKENCSRRKFLGKSNIRDTIDLKHEAKDEDESSLGCDFEDEVSVKAEKIPVKKCAKRKAAAAAAEEPIVDQAKKIKLTKTFLEDYGPQLNYSYQLWKKNSKVLDRAAIDGDFTGNPTEWTVKNVCSFISRLTEDTSTVAKFQEQEIDGAAFVSMGQDDLVDLMNIKIGLAIKIYNRIMHLREEIMLNFVKV